MRRAAALLCAAICAGPVWAQTADTAAAAEIALWKAVTARGLPSDYEGYLALYPNGRFAPLARVRLGAGAPAATPPATSSPAPSPTPAAGATLRVAAPQVRRTDGIVVDVDATALRNGSNHRLIVVPAGTPDAVGDPDAFAAASSAVPMGRQHLVLPPGPPGADEVRLYTIPPYGGDFVVAARAPVRVGAGAAGAVLARDLVQEANRIGPVRFLSAHRDRRILVEAGFLRVLPSTEWNPVWFGGLPIGQVANRALVISVGQAGAVPDRWGSLNEVVCILPDTPALVDRAGAMQLGDPVQLSGVPVTWESGPVSAVQLDRCQLQ